MTTDTLAAALDYAARYGWHVFPTGRTARVPLVKHGVYSASNEPDAIRAMWRPGANVSCAMGPRCGAFALDVDSKEGVDGFAALEALQDRFSMLPKSWRTRTPSGGVHLWFRQPEGVTLRNKVGLVVETADGGRAKYAGLDIRSHGASVALPPSSKPSGVYAWEVSPDDMALADAPAWLIELAVDRPPPPRKPSLRVALGLATSSGRDRIARYVERAVDSEAAAVAGMGKNSGRNLRLFQAAANLGELIGAGLLPSDMARHALEDAALSCGLTQEDGHHSVNATITSGFRKGIANPREIAA